MNDSPDSLSINALDIELGSGVDIGERTRIGGIGGSARRLRIGRHVSIGHDVTILAPDIEIGDYTVIHNHTLIYGYSPVSIGACSWIGQNVVLNCTDRLEIGRGCTISAYASLWTHFSGGDPLQGCRFNSRKSLSIGEDSWIGVQCSVAPVTIGARALLLAGSVLTKDIGDDQTWGGNPSIDLTDKLGSPFKVVDAQTKYRQLCAMLDRFMAGEAKLQSGEPLPDPGDGTAWPADGHTREGIMLTHSGLRDPRYSVFDTAERSYSALDTEQEVAFMKWLLPLIRFYARGYSSQ
jgi:acetyltransferase-like isoleucine patch superfamily enzyme